MHCVEPTFDTIALQYDELWSSTVIGKLQRQAVWDAVDPLFEPGDFVLDLGCGTGIDALHFEAAGVHVYGIDNSPKMIEVARKRGVRADCHRIEDLHCLPQRFNGAISNFGALNCVNNLEHVASGLAKMVHRGGHVALCFLGRVCAWEIAYYLSHRNIGKAFRRLSGRSHSELAKNVFYFSGGFILSTFQPYFRLKKRCGIGFCMPPSYVGSLRERAIKRLSLLDKRLADLPLLRSLSDHSLYVLERL